MAIVVCLDRLLNNRKMPAKTLASRIKISVNNVSRINTGKIKAMRFSTLNGICKELDCKPGDLLDYVDDEEIDPSKHIVCWSSEDEEDD